MMQETKVVTSDNAVLYVHSWCVDQPKAVILLAHGMAEHSMRYAAFGEFLNTHGIMTSVDTAKQLTVSWDICVKGSTGS